MNIDFLHRIGVFVALLVVQVLILNHVHLFNVATPLLYVYIALHFSPDYPRWGVLLWCFAMGLLVDMFSNTLGVAAASMTLVGLVQPSLLKLFLPRDADEGLVPSMNTLGPGKFVPYVLILTFIYMVAFFSLDSFNFFNWELWLVDIFGSWALTMVLILVMEHFRRH